METDEARVECVKAKIGLRVIAEEKRFCGINISCRERLKQKVFDVVEFRVYNIEERAEAYLETNEEQVVDFIAQMELKKQEFRNAQTIAAKKEVISEVGRLWAEFRNSVGGIGSGSEN